MTMNKHERPKCMQSPLAETVIRLGCNGRLMPVLLTYICSFSCKLLANVTYCRATWMSRVTSDVCNCCRCWRCIRRDVTAQRRRVAPGVSHHWWILSAACSVSAVVWPLYQAACQWDVQREEQVRLDKPVPQVRAVRLQDFTCHTDAQKVSRLQWTVDSARTNNQLCILYSTVCSQLLTYTVQLCFPLWLLCFLVDFIQKYKIIVERKLHIFVSLVPFDTGMNAASCNYLKSLIIFSKFP